MQWNFKFSVYPLLSLSRTHLFSSCYLMVLVACVLCVHYVTCNCIWKNMYSELKTSLYNKVHVGKWRNDNNNNVVVVAVVLLLLFLCNNLSNKIIVINYSLHQIPCCIRQHHTWTCRTHGYHMGYQFTNSVEQLCI